MPNNAYSALAEIYEKVIIDSEYEKWKDYIVDLVKEYSTGNKGIDMACGSGYFTRALSKNGFDIEGVDLSVDMLNEATRLARQEHLNISFRQGDILSVKNFKKVDFITIINDGINYIPPLKLEKALKNLYGLLNKNGVLIFDISSKYKLENVLGNNIFAEDNENLTYVWFNKLFDDRVEMDLSVFTKKGDMYQKKEESQTEYIHTVENITENLKKSGYRTVIAQNHMQKNLTNDALRVQFIAIK